MFTLNKIAGQWIDCCHSGRSRAPFDREQSLNSGQKWNDSLHNLNMENECESNGAKPSELC